ncbi:sensor histidine kinase [Paenibacillus sp.]|uniref:sensor histidine kinase n=1 Tax=Paenibacillus sp. TaxID=58172 RepID=UPI002D2D1AEF|nr:histidine kinase [Paenibacillus sp.]HZG57813.1 histidine kinase [Paenibacillus sp.]
MRADRPDASGKSRWNTIFPKLALAFLIVVTPLYGIGLVMIKLGESSVRKELANSLSSRTNFFVDSLEKEVAHTLNLLNHIAVDKDLHRLTFTGQHMKINEWSDAVLRLESKLRLVKDSSALLQGVHAHLVEQRRTLSTEHSITDRLSDDYRATEAIYRLPDRSFFPWEQRLFLAVPFPESNSPHALSPSFVLQVEINLSELRALFAQFKEYESSGAVMVNLNQGWDVANRKDEPVLFALKSFLGSRAQAGPVEGVERLDAEGVAYLVAYRYSEPLNSFLTVYVRQDALLGPIQLYQRLLWGLSALSVLVILGYSYWMYRLIHRPLNKLIRSFRKVEEGQWTPIALPKSGDEFTDLMRHFNMMVHRLSVLFHEVVEQQTRAQRAELKQLQAQINPHFLYNTYFTLYRKAKDEDLESVVRLCRYMGEYFQYITRNASDEVSLESEVRHAKTYVDIQNMRFSNRIDVEFGTLPEGCGHAAVPRLVLQPVLENAYKYGMEKKLKNGKIAVGIRREGRRVVVSVEDNGESLTDDALAALEEGLLFQSPETEYTGLLNVHRRLRLRFGDEAGIAVSRSELGGLKVDVCIRIEGGS